MAQKWGWREGDGWVEDGGKVVGAVVVAVVVTLLPRGGHLQGPNERHVRGV